MSRWRQYADTKSLNLNYSFQWPEMKQCVLLIAGLGSNSLPILSASNEISAVYHAVSLQ